MPYTVLVVEDNQEILSNVRDFLILKGFCVETAVNGADALERLTRGSFNLCILDIGLPIIDGLSICQTLRQHSNPIPILLLTARDSIDDRVRGFDCGADDYLIKPFVLKELVARVQALLRRSYGQEEHSLTVGDIQFNLQTLEVKRNGQTIHLNPTCLSILKELMIASPAVVSRTRLENVLWNGMPPDSDSLRANVYLLRKAIDKSFNSPLITTHPGLGWSLGDRS